jgi:hypothetical protein
MAIVACKIGFRLVHFRNSRRTVSLQFLAFVYTASRLASKCPAFWLRPSNFETCIFGGCTATGDITSLCSQGCGRCGSAALPASVIEAVRPLLLRYEHIKFSGGQNCLPLKSNYTFILCILPLQYVATIFTKLKRVPLFDFVLRGASSCNCAARDRTQYYPFARRVAY